MLRTKRLSFIGMLILAVVGLGTSAAFVLKNRGHSSSLGGSPYHLSQLVSYVSPSAVTKIPTVIGSRESKILSTLPSATTLFARLGNSGFSETFEGSPVPNRDIAAMEATCLVTSVQLAATNAYINNLDPTAAMNEITNSSYCQDQGTAMATLKVVVALAAVQDGTAVSIADAKAFADQTLAEEVAAAGTPNATVLPAGETLADITTCAQCILGYQQTMTFNSELSKIENGATTVPQMNQKIVDWFNGQLAAAGSSGLQINGDATLSGSNLGSFLSPALH